VSWGHVTWPLDRACCGTCLLDLANPFDLSM
jgi:hypothetical protein